MRAARFLQKKMRILTFLMLFHFFVCVGLGRGREMGGFVFFFLRVYAVRLSFQFVLFFFRKPLYSWPVLSFSTIKKNKFLFLSPI